MRRSWMTACILGLAWLCSSAAAAATLQATVAELPGALRSAAPGDTIRLKGDGWGDQRWDHVVKAAPGVVVEPGPGARSVFASLTISNSEGVGVKGVTFASQGAQAVKILSSKRITLEDCEISGDTKITDGLWVRASTDVTIRGCRLHDLWHGVFHEANTRLTVEDSDFRELYSDALRGGRDSDGVIFRRLRITDLHQVGADHLDAIQFWTTGATRPTRNVLIEEVVYRRGKGDPAQGVFVGNETNIPYENIVVRRFAAVGGLYHGISLSGVTGGVVEDCFLQPMIGGFDAKHRAIDRVWIQFRRSAGGKARDNIATSFKSSENMSEPSSSGFKAVAIAKEGDYAALDAWLARHRLRP